MWKMLLPFSTAVGVAVGSPLVAQIPGITVAAGTQISKNAPNTPHFETFLAVNPHDPQNLVATSFGVQPNARGSTVYMESPVYTSFDGGRSWRLSRTTATDSSGGGHEGDPVVYFGPDGTAFYYTINASGNIIRRSNDGGHTWSPPLKLPIGINDRQYMAVDTTNGPYRGYLYLSGMTAAMQTDGTQLVAGALVRSTNGGRWFDRQRVVVLGDEWVKGEVFAMPSTGEPVVTPDGRVTVPLITRAAISSQSDTVFAGHLSLLVSEDGGSTFLPVTPGPSTRSLRGGDMRGVAGIRTAVDASAGPHRGTIYMVWPNYEDEHVVIRLARTTDLGRTWNTTVVNDSRGFDASTPSVAVNKDGVVAVSWYDRRDDPQNQCFRLYFAASVDGGVTFTPGVPLADGGSCPSAPKNLAPYSNDRPAAFVGTFELTAQTGRATNGGETHGLQADTTGRFHVVFINGSTGVMQMWYTSVLVDPSVLRAAAAKRGGYDAGADVELLLTDARLDAASHTLTVRTRLRNRGATALISPVRVEITRVRSFLPGLRAANAADTSAAGATWIVPVGSGEVLAAGAISLEWTMQWTFVGDPPAHPNGSIFKVDFRVPRPPQP